MHDVEHTPCQNSMACRLVGERTAGSSHRVSSFSPRFASVQAGEGEDGRLKSAIGIGSLLMDGLGDTIRVSLTEDPEFELEPCRSVSSLPFPSLPFPSLPFPPLPSLPSPLLPSLSSPPPPAFPSIPFWGCMIGISWQSSSSKATESLAGEPLQFSQLCKWRGCSLYSACLPSSPNSFTHSFI